MRRISAEEALDNAEVFAKGFFQGYRDRVKKHYTEAKSQRPDLFPFCNPTKLIIIEFANNHVFCLFTSSASDEVCIIRTNEKQNTAYIVSTTEPKWYQQKVVSEIAGIDPNKVLKNCPIHEFELLSFSIVTKQHKHYIVSASYDQGGQEADSHFNEYELELAVRNASQPTDQYPHFEIETLLQRVNNDQFSYEIREAIKCYNTELFLAATIVIAIGMETILKQKIVSALGTNHLPNEADQTLFKLAKKLKDNHMISERLNQRIVSFNYLRRGSGHSKTGVIEAGDAQFGFSVLDSMIQELF